MNRIGNFRLINSVLRLDQKNGLSNSLQKNSKNTTMSHNFNSFTALLSITHPNLCQSSLVIDNHLYTDLISTPCLLLLQSFLSIDNHLIHFHLSLQSIELQQILIKFELIFSLFQVIMNQVWKSICIYTSQSVSLAEYHWTPKRSRIEWRDLHSNNIIKLADEMPMT